MPGAVVAEAWTEAGLSPPILLAVTLKKNRVPLGSPVTVCEVVVRFRTAVTPGAVRLVIGDVE